MVETVLAAGPRLDILINNVGGGTTTAEAMGDPLDGDDGLWDEVYALNLFATVRTTRHALPALTRSRGSIVNISSNSARTPFGTPANGGMLTGTLIDPAEIARAVLLLASPAMPSAIGQIWAVDAGSVKAV